MPAIGFLGPYAKDPNVFVVISKANATCYAFSITAGVRDVLLLQCH